MRGVRFILGIAVGWFLADRAGLPLLQSALWMVAASLVLTLLALVVQHVTLPPAARSRRGLTVFQGQFGRLFLGTIITMVVTAAVVVLIRQRAG